jgi:hypothetical protein
VYYDVPTGSVEPLADSPPPELVEDLRRRGVEPLSIGRVIVATWEPHEQMVLQAIHSLNLDLQVIFNKGAVMVLPTGVNKASGLLRALEHLKLSAHNTVGIGDAENDLPFLSTCGCAVAVANALGTVKARAHWVTASNDGESRSRRRSTRAARRNDERSGSAARKRRRQSHGRSPFRPSAVPSAVAPSPARITGGDGAAALGRHRRGTSPAAGIRNGHEPYPDRARTQWCSSPCTPTTSRGRH